MRHLSYTLATIMILATTSVYAGYTDWVTITQLGTGNNNDRVNIWISAKIANPAGCSSADFLQANETIANRDSIFSIALAAVMAGKQVRIYYSDTVCSAAQRPRIQAIQVR